MAHGLRRLKLGRLDRLTRHFGWQLLHGGVRCGAATMHWCQVRTTGELQAAVCCPTESRHVWLLWLCLMGRVCRIWLTVSHVFLHCAAVPVVNWLLGLWARIAPEDAPVPLDARVLLLGDESVWVPAGGEAAQTPALRYSGS
jgi:hypothetical protein